MASKEHSSNLYFNYETSYKMADIREDLVYSQAGLDAVIQMGKSASGVDLSQSEYSNWVGWQQDALASGRSMADIRNQFAHEDFVKEVAINMHRNMGVNASEQDIVRIQDQLGEGRSYQEVLSEYNHR